MQRELPGGEVSERAKAIYYNFLMRLSKRGPDGYWLIDLKDDNKTPKVVIEKHGECNQWRAVVHQTDSVWHGLVICQHYDTRKQAVAMAEYRLAKLLATEGSDARSSQAT